MTRGRKLENSPNHKKPDDNLRTCIASNRKLSKFKMVRFVMDSENRPVPDLNEKLPGRGLWLTADYRLINKASVKNLFAKNTRKYVHIDYDIPELLVKLMVERCIQNLGLAKRAGQVLIGFDELKRALADYREGYVFAARDGSFKNRKKIFTLARNIPILEALTATEIGIAFGRNRVVHAFIFSGGLGDNLFRDMGRLAGLRETTLAA